MTQDDLRTYFLLRALGQYAAPGTGIEWNPSNDVLLDGELDFEPTADGGTRLTEKVTDGSAPRPDEPACRQTALRRWRPSANSSMIFELKAGRSAGRRLETRPLSLRTSSSTQRAPAFWRSVRSVG
jgi:hypothetical protein